MFTSAITIVGLLLIAGVLIYRDEKKEQIKIREYFDE